MILVGLCLLVLASVNAIPATITSTAPASTLFAVSPTLSGGATFSPIGSQQIDASVIGISTDSAGTETTYSVGQYISVPINIVKTESGSVTTISEPGAIQIWNFTLVESSAGEWATYSAFVHGNQAGDGLYQTCSFVSGSGQSAICSEIDYDPTLGLGGSTTGLEIDTTTYEGTKESLTILDVSGPVPTSSSATTSPVSTTTPSPTSNTAPTSPGSTATPSVTSNAAKLNLRDSTGHLYFYSVLLFAVLCIV